MFEIIGQRLCGSRMTSFALKLVWNQNTFNWFRGPGLCSVIYNNFTRRGVVWLPSVQFVYLCLTGCTPEHDDEILPNRRCKCHFDEECIRRGASWEIKNSFMEIVCLGKFSSLPKMQDSVNLLNKLTVLHHFWLCLLIIY